MKINHPSFPKTATFLTAALLSLALFTPKLSANTVSYTSSTQLVQSSFLDFNLGQFDISLGALTGVAVTVDFATLQGAFTVHNNDVTLSTITDYQSLFSINGSTNALGYTSQSNVTIDRVSTTPSWATNIAALSLQTFTINGGQDFTSYLAHQTVNIAPGYFSAYEGSGSVTFQARDVQSITTTGSSYTLDSGSAGATTQLTVTYTYSPVPEPSTFILFSLGVLALVMIYRRSAA